MTSLTTAWLTEVAAIAYRDAKQAAAGNLANSRPIPHIPLPSELTAVMVVYTALAIVPTGGQQIAGLIGWGIVVATVLNLWDPTTIHNAGGVAVLGGPSTKTASGAPVAVP